MKPFKSTLLVIALFSTSSYAQTYAGEHELSISYGIIPAKYDGYNNIDAYGDGTTETATSGNIFVTYKYFFDKQFSIGACAGIQTINGSIYYDGGILEDNFKLINKTVAGEFTFVYANKRYYHFYAFMGFGVVSTSIISNSPVSANIGYSSWGIVTPDIKPSTGTTFTYQLDPVCISFGKKLSGYVELGFGYKGVLNAGMSYCLGKNKLGRERNDQDK